MHLHSPSRPHCYRDTETVIALPSCLASLFTLKSLASASTWRPTTIDLAAGCLGRGGPKTVLMSLALRVRRTSDAIRSAFPGVPSARNRVHRSSFPARLSVGGMAQDRPIGEGRTCPGRPSAFGSRGGPAPPVLAEPGAFMPLEFLGRPREPRERRLGHEVWLRRGIRTNGCHRTKQAGSRESCDYWPSLPIRMPMAGIDQRR